jgi:hypothetical protein
MQEYTNDILRQAFGQWWQVTKHAILILSGEGITPPSEQQETDMHDLFVAIVFLAMLLLPCVVATLSGTSEA